ncbi:hypothetical protein CERSUDRAFT_125027 [Gelatoporia subvermispora B]|uniref:Uncharacterized protein n=1 Tax=Ceriporiopsis subvermispora (strain B) TaxID=914234 RepID=M2QDC8_CERS8|nr:hypothetical protein CERSUDRAFT_125027 [Gelatoporia subvermispora B]
MSSKRKTGSDHDYNCASGVQDKAQRPYNSDRPLLPPWGRSISVLSNSDNTSQTTRALCCRHAHLHLAQETGPQPPQCPAAFAFREHMDRVFLIAPAQTTVLAASSAVLVLDADRPIACRRCTATAGSDMSRQVTKLRKYRKRRNATLLSRKFVARTSAGCGDRRPRDYVGIDHRAGGPVRDGWRWWRSTRQRSDAHRDRGVGIDKDMVPRNWHSAIDRAPVLEGKASCQVNKDDVHCQAQRTRLLDCAAQNGWVVSRPLALREPFFEENRMLFCSFTVVADASDLGARRMHVPAPSFSSDKLQACAKSPVIHNPLQQAARSPILLSRTQQKTMALGIITTNKIELRRMLVSPLARWRGVLIPGTTKRARVKSQSYFRPISVQITHMPSFVFRAVTHSGTLYATPAKHRGQTLKRCAGRDGIMEHRMKLRILKSSNRASPGLLAAVVYHDVGSFLVIAMLHVSRRQYCEPSNVSLRRDKGETQQAINKPQ